MPDTIVEVSGPNGLPTDGVTYLDRNSVVPVSVNTGSGALELIGATVAQLLAAFGDIGASGDIAVTGHIGALGFTIQNNTVTLGKLAPLASGHLIGRSSGGTGVPEAIQVDNDTLTMTGGVLRASAAGQVPPSVHLLIYQSRAKF